MSYVYDIQCSNCSEKVGEVSFKTEPSLDKLRRCLSGYICQECIDDMNQPIEEQDYINGSFSKYL